MLYYQSFQKLEYIQPVDAADYEQSGRFYCPLFRRADHTTELSEIEIWVSLLNKSNKGALIALRVFPNEINCRPEYRAVFSSKMLRSFYCDGLTPMTWVPVQGGHDLLICACWSKSVIGSRYTIWPGILDPRIPDDIVKITSSEIDIQLHNIVSISAVKKVYGEYHCWLALSRPGEVFFNADEMPVEKYDYCHATLNFSSNNGWEISNIKRCTFSNFEDLNLVGIGRSEIVFDGEKDSYLGMFSMRTASGYLAPQFYHSLNGTSWVATPQVGGELKKTRLLFANTIETVHGKFVCGNKTIGGDDQLHAFFVQKRAR